jgi:hypothetical protein
MGSDVFEAVLEALVTHSDINATTITDDGSNARSSCSSVAEADSHAEAIYEATV